MGVGVGAGSGADAEGREDAMDATLAMLMRLIDRMDASDTWQVAMGEELLPLYAAVPTGPACAAVAQPHRHVPSPTGTAFASTNSAI